MRRTPRRLPRNSADATAATAAAPVDLDETDSARFERSLAELQREKRLVETLYRVSQAVAREDDLRAIVQIVTDEATAVTGAQFGAFFYNVVGRDGELPALYAISGAPREKFETFPTPRATEIFRPTFEGTAIVRIDDVLADPRFGRNAPYNGMPDGHLPVRSYLAVPVFSRDGSVVGGLVFGHEKIGVFAEEHERIAVGIATQAGTAVDKARLFAAEREARSEAEARGAAAISLECVEDGVVMVNEEGVIRLWNRAAATITGLDPGAVLGRLIGEALPGWERIALDVPVGQLEQGIAPQTLPLDILEGREVWLSLYGVAFENGTVYAFRDVTDERHLDSLRTDIIATVSHELRTPIAAVYGAAQTLLRRDTLDPELSTQLLAIVSSESERLAALVDEILLASQLESSGFDVARDSLDARRVVESVVEAVRLTAGGASLAVEVQPDLPPIRADEHRLRQVLHNLVENALKYGNRGELSTVTVLVRALRTTVRFEIIDDGPGIPPREQTRIFEKFYRLDPHMTRGVRGTGLGLYICRELVHRMAGRIGVESVEGSGATFWFELPLA